MDCGRTRELVCACVDEELDPQLSEEVRTHLAQCPSCADLYRVQRTVKALLHRSCSEDTVAPAGLRERVWASVLAQCHRPGETSVTVNTTQTTISTTTASGVLVRRTLFTGTVVRATYRGPATPGGAEDQRD
ncbi:mycothiol system anti-sigma-R factor [Raineyella antarctica]|uniref:Mycothiol system anti-sigma-R factor n=1 Tax=Raineyella antarctica TaxID=1577474 RepID=A0A1G6GUX9_9ACTN|nr:mycothiol system anti-sigma-R factor [Raineyella antarctica]